MRLPRSGALRFLPSRTGDDRGTPAGLLLDGAGRLRTMEDEESVRQAILLLLATRPGERVMRPDYGCDLHRIAFQPNDATTAGLAMHYVRQAVERWEPRARIVRMDANPHPEDACRLLVEIEYQILRTGSASRVVHEVSLTGEGSP